MLASVRLDLVYKFFHPDLFAFDHSFEGRSAATHFPLMGALRVVMLKPFIEIDL